MESHAPFRLSLDSSDISGIEVRGRSQSVARDDRRNPSALSRILSSFRGTDQQTTVSRLNSSMSSSTAPSSSKCLESIPERLNRSASNLDVVIQQPECDCQAPHISILRDIIPVFQKAEFSKYRGVICEIMRNKQFNYQNVLYDLFMQKEKDDPIYRFREATAKYAASKYDLTSAHGERNADTLRKDSAKQDFVDNYVNYQYEKLVLGRDNLNLDPLIIRTLKDIVRKYPGENLLSVRDKISTMDDYDYISAVYANKPGNGGLRSTVGSFATLLVDGLGKTLRPPDSESGIFKQPLKEKRENMSRYQLTNVLRIIYNDLTHAEGVLTQISIVYQGKATSDSKDFKGNCSLLTREDTPKLSASGSKWRKALKETETPVKQTPFISIEDFDYDIICEEGSRMIFELTRNYLSTVKHLIDDVGYLSVNFAKTIPSGESFPDHKFRDLLSCITSDLSYIHKTLNFAICGCDIFSNL